MKDDQTGFVFFINACAIAATLAAILFGLCGDCVLLELFN
jgi:hypothetical protein